jgi:mRNA-degrading endonuclease RelE of RelBE toxin-antitoxin system
MFEIVFRPLAIKQLRKIKRYYAGIIVNAIARHLSEEPEKTHGSIKRLRGRQDATFRLRVQNYRVFYDVAEDKVEIIQVLHKSETPSFYQEGDK